MRRRDRRGSPARWRRKGLLRWRRVVQSFPCLKSALVEHCKLRFINFGLGLRQQDVAEGVALLQTEAAEAHQLERGEKDGDQLVAVAPFEEPLQADGRLLLHLRVEACRFLLA